MQTLSPFVTLMLESLFFSFLVIEVDCNKTKVIVARQVDLYGGILKIEVDPSKVAIKAHRKNITMWETVFYNHSNIQD